MCRRSFEAIYYVTITFLLFFFLSFLALPILVQQPMCVWRGGGTKAHRQKKETGKREMQGCNKDAIDSEIWEGSRGWKRTIERTCERTPSSDRMKTQRWMGAKNDGNSRAELHSWASGCLDASTYKSHGTKRSTKRTMQATNRQIQRPAGHARGPRDGENGKQAHKARQFWKGSIEEVKKNEEEEIDGETEWKERREKWDDAIMKY
jgi:hypothetical protein